MPQRLDRHDLLLFILEQFVDLTGEIFGQFLHFVFELLNLVFGKRAVFDRLFQRFEAFAAIMP